MVTYVTQNFQVLEQNSTARKPPISKKHKKITNRFDVVPNVISNRVNNLEQPIVKYSAKPSMLLPKSVVKVEQNPIEFFKSYNNGLYELLLKTKRRNLIAKYSASQGVNSLKSDSFVHQTNCSAFSDKLCSPYEDERLNSFINSLTNKRRKTALTSNNRAQSAKYRNESLAAYEAFSQQKPIYAVSKPPSPELLMSLPDAFNNFNLKDQINNNNNNNFEFFETVDHVSKALPRAQTAMSYDVNQINNSYNDRPITAQGINREHASSTPPQQLYSLLKLMKSSKHDSVEQSENPLRVRLYSEKFVRLLNKSRNSESSPLDSNRNLNSDLSNPDCIDSYQMTNAIKNKWKINQATLSELYDEDLERIEMIELNQYQLNNDHIKPTPTPDLLVYHEINNKNQNDTNNQLKDKNKSKLHLNMMDSTNKSPNLSDFNGNRESLSSRTTNKSNEKQSNNNDNKNSNDNNTIISSNTNKVKKKMKKNLINVSSEPKKDNFLASAIHLSSVQNNAEDAGVTSQMQQNYQEKNSNNIQNSNELAKMRENEKRTKILNPKEATILNNINNNETKLETETKAENQDTYTISLNSNNTGQTTTTTTTTNRIHNKKTTQMDHHEPQTFMGKLYNSDANKSATSSYAAHNGENVNKLFLTKRVPLTSKEFSKKKEDVVKKDDSQFLYVKQSLVQMLDFELSEAKKDDLSLQSILNGIREKDVKVNNTIGRLALSKSVCRFELPMDMKLLESMEPVYYLTHYCKINDRRKSFYKKIFERYKIKSDKEDYVDMNLLEECLMDVHMRSINKNQYTSILNLICLPSNLQINFTLFCGIAALSERVLYSQFVTEDTMDLPEYQKDKIECADFGSLKSKLDGIKVSKAMLNLLQSL